MINAAITTAFVIISIVMALDLGITTGGILSGGFVETNPVYTGSPVPTPYADKFFIIAGLALSKAVASVMIVFGIDFLKFIGETYVDVR